MPTGASASAWVTQSNTEADFNHTASNNQSANGVSDKFKSLKKKAKKLGSCLSGDSFAASPDNSAVQHNGYPYANQHPVTYQHPPAQSFLGSWFLPSASAHAADVCRIAFGQSDLSPILPHPAPNQYPVQYQHPAPNQYPAQYQHPAQHPYPAQYQHPAQHFSPSETIARLNNLAAQTEPVIAQEYFGVPDLSIDSINRLCNPELYAPATAPASAFEPAPAVQHVEQEIPPTERAASPPGVPTEEAEVDSRTGLTYKDFLAEFHDKIDRFDAQPVGHLSNTQLQERAQYRLQKIKAHEDVLNRLRECEKRSELAHDRLNQSREKQSLQREQRAHEREYQQLVDVINAKQTLEFTTDFMRSNPYV